MDFYSFTYVSNVKNHLKIAITFIATVKINNDDWIESDQINSIQMTSTARTSNLILFSIMYSNIDHKLIESIQPHNFHS